MLGMDLRKSYLDRKLAVPPIEKPLQQLENALLLFERPEQLAHPFTRQVEVKANQVFRAVEVDLRYQP